MVWSGQRKIGFDHGFNDALFGRDKNNPYNAAVVAGSFAAYEEGYELGLLSDVPPRGPQGDQGEQGPQGPQGSSGNNGADGNRHLVGSGPPGAGLGNDGDIYTDVDTGSIYSKAAGVWNLVGTPSSDSDQARLLRYFLGE